MIAATSRCGRSLKSTGSLDTGSAGAAAKLRCRTRCARRLVRVNQTPEGKNSTSSIVCVATSSGACPVAAPVQSVGVHWETTGLAMRVWQLEARSSVAAKVTRALTRSAATHKLSSSCWFKPRAPALHSPRMSLLLPNPSSTRLHLRLLRILVGRSRFLDRRQSRCHFRPLPRRCTAWTAAGRRGSWLMAHGSRGPATAG